MPFVSEHVSAFVVSIDTLCCDILAQFIPSLIKIANGRGAPVTHFLPVVASVADIGPFWIRFSWSASIVVQTWSELGR